MLPQIVPQENKYVVRSSTCKKEATAMDGKLIVHHHVFLRVEMISCHKPHLFFAEEKRNSWIPQVGPRVFGREILNHTVFSTLPSNDVTPFTVNPAFRPYLFSFEHSFSDYLKPLQNLSRKTLEQIEFIPGKSVSWHILTWFWTFIYCIYLGRQTCHVP